MKKTMLIILLLLLVLFSVFPQSKPKAVSEENGFDWVVWTWEQKLSYIKGWFSAYSSLYERYLHMAGDTTDRETMREVENMFLINQNTGEIKEGVDRYYSSYENRKYRLIDVMLIVIGKDYWN